MGIYIHKGLVATKLEMSARRQDHRRRDIAHTPHLSTLIGGCTQLKCLEHYGEVSCPQVSFTFFETYKWRKVSCLFVLYHDGPADNEVFTRDIRAFSYSIVLCFIYFINDE